MATYLHTKHSIDQCRSTTVRRQRGRKSGSRREQAATARSRGDVSKQRPTIGHLKRSKTAAVAMINSQWWKEEVVDDISL
ncbi:hypothetical protein L1887_10363 [Cichorium endivia]|nr:hypothetical protein L1887_10363 [Cichorium endivia]